MGLFAVSAFTIHILYSVCVFLIFNHFNICVLTLLVHNYDKTSYIVFLLNTFVKMDEKSRNI